MNFYRHWHEGAHDTDAPDEQTDAGAARKSEQAELVSAGHQALEARPLDDAQGAEHADSCGYHGGAGAHCSLAELPRGVRARVVDFSGEPHERGRLCSMGLTPGAEVMVSGEGNGQRLFNVRNCSYALDRELAGRIMCSLTDCWPEVLEKKTVAQDERGNTPGLDGKR